MPTSLSPELQARYRDDGFLFPIDVMTADEAHALRAELETLEADYATAPDALPRPFHRYLRSNAHYVTPLAAGIVRHPAILDAVESVLGRDLLVWGCDFFIKEAGSTSIVSWHQDLTYWGFGETSDQVTAWLALSDVTEASGCMRFVKGTHKQPIVPHRDTFAEENLLSRGQEIAVDVDEADATMIELKPGQMSLHHGLMFHASGPNTSNDRRIGVAVRYLNPNAQQKVAARDYAMLVRGVDRVGSFIHVAPPEALFPAGALALYDDVMEDQTKALGAGATRAGTYFDSVPAS